MRIWTVMAEVRQERRFRIAAADQVGAIRMVERTLPRGSRVLSAQAVSERQDDGAGRRALDRLLTRQYLPLAGDRDTSVLEHLQAAACTSPHDDSFAAWNARLACAGLRLRSDMALAVASAVSHPVIADWFAGTPFEGPNLVEALMTLPGARRTNLTFAGLGARAVIVPAECWTDPLPTDGGDAAVTGGRDANAA